MRRGLRKLWEVRRMSQGATKAKMRFSDGDSEMEREKFKSRLGFLLISAGCAIGIGNVYRFPIIAGLSGGAVFVMVYILFLLVLGIPVMTAELAVGRASRRSIAASFDRLECKGQRWHIWKYFGIAGNYILIMCYTTITAWMVIYFFKYLGGGIVELQTPVDLERVFSDMVSAAGIQAVTVVGIIAACFAVCAVGLQQGVEKVTKVMMLLLFAIMLALAIYCCTLDGAREGLKFYLLPDGDSVDGILPVISAAMGQAFFTLSLGMGSIAVFGSYIGKERGLLGESLTIVGLDTFVALMSGFIIFPASFTFAGGVDADTDVGASFLFTNLAGIFNNMPGGRLVGCVFFLLLVFAAVSTVIAVFENIMSFWLDTTRLKRPAVAAINTVLLCVLSLPSVFSNNLLENVSLFGMSIMDFEDFLVAKLLLPVGSIIYVLFCTTRYGWGWKKYFAEVNSGGGPKLAGWMRGYMTFVLPVIIMAVLVLSMIGR